MGIENSVLLIAQLKRQEDVRSKSYSCPAGYLTIGVGHNLDANPVEGIDKDSVLNSEQIDRLLAFDLRNFAKELDVKISWWRGLNEPRQAVILNMAFNLGVRNLLGFRNTLEFVRTGDFERASTGMLLSKWANQVGSRARELARQMLTGQWA